MLTRFDDDGKFLDWLADRLVDVYHESPNVDFVQKLQRIAKKVRRLDAKRSGDISRKSSRRSGMTAARPG